MDSIYSSGLNTSIVCIVAVEIKLLQNSHILYIYISAENSIKLDSKASHKFLPSKALRSSLIEGNYALIKAPPLGPRNAHTIVPITRP